MSSYEDNWKAIDRLCKESLSDLAEEADVHTRFQRLCATLDNEVDKGDLFKRNIWEKALVRRILQVNERLRLTRYMKDDAGESFERKYLYSPLRGYLLLTCFDQLGQPHDGWISFEAWLVSKKHKEERAQTFASHNPSDFENGSRMLFQTYQKIYGVRSSFFRFLREVLPGEQRARLHECLRLELYHDYPKSTQFVGASADDKDDYLYSLRNDFTHNTYAPGIYHGVHASDRAEEWRFGGTVYRKGKTIWIYTKEAFYNELVRSVEMGMWAKLCSASN